MIPTMNIIAWGRTVPWGEQRQIEQDLADVRPLLAVEEARRFGDDAARLAFVTVFQNFIKRIPGRAWKKTMEMAEQNAMPELGEA